MKIETNTKITIKIGDQEFTLTRSEAEELYNKLKTELGKSDTIIWPKQYPEPQNPLPHQPQWVPTTYPDIHPYPSYPQVWCKSDNTYSGVQADPTKI